MKILAFFLLSVLLSACTPATSQTSVPTEPTEKGSCLTAEPVCEPTYASNIKASEQSIVIAFENHTICFGKTWNCLAVYENDDLIYFGDGDHFWLDSVHLVVSGTTAEISVDVTTGTATGMIDGCNKTFNRPTYNGAVAKAN